LLYIIDKISKICYHRSVHFYRIMVTSVINQDQETETPLEGNLNPARDVKRGPLLNWSEQRLESGVIILSYTGMVNFFGGHPYVVPTGNHSDIMRLQEAFRDKFERYSPSEAIRTNFLGIPLWDLLVGYCCTRPGTKTTDVFPGREGWRLQGVQNGMPVRVSFHRRKPEAGRLLTLGWVAAYPTARKRAFQPPVKLQPKPAEEQVQEAVPA
jgi:hypothetical protein